MAQHITSTPAIEHTDAWESLIKELEAENPILGALNDAIRNGDSELLKVLLERDCYIDESLVEVACEQKDRDIIRVLLAFGWPIKKPLRFDMSILSFAVDDLDFIQFLVQLGADVNARSKLDESALSVAICRGNMDVIRFLIAHGTDLNHGDLLHCAAIRSNQFEGADLINELVREGAAVCAYQYDNPVAFRWRGLQRAPTPLHIACKNGNLLVAEALLRHGADPDQLMLEAGELTRPSSIDIALQREDRTMIDLLTGKR